ncbi:MAG: T9SS type A sorting domain-containing protein, partial [Bacteroidetes bacterium]|nr:T9SS type A sorting domain-containing protein [Bacteroidota bacterium]
ERLHYQFIDNEAVQDGAGEVYYRLEQVDIDGTLDWSYPVVVALPDSGMKVNVHPNPFSDRLLIELQSARQHALQLRLLNLEGRMLLQQHVAPSQATAGVSLAGVEELPAGIYVLEISDAEAVSQIKIVKK